MLIILSITYFMPKQLVLRLFIETSNETPYVYWQIYTPFQN